MIKFKSGDIIKLIGTDTLWLLTFGSYGYPLKFTTSYYNHPISLNLESAGWDLVTDIFREEE